jgi:hypothetical protein
METKNYLLSNRKQLSVRSKESIPSVSVKRGQILSEFCAWFFDNKGLAIWRAKCEDAYLTARLLWSRMNARTPWNNPVAPWVRYPQVGNHCFVEAFNHYMFRSHKLSSSGKHSVLCLPPALYLARLTQSWRWRQYIPAKCQLTFNGLHCVIFQKIVR